jgi:hypothetical protein
MDIWLAWFDSYDEKARTVDGSGSDFDSGPDSNLDLPYEIEFGFGSEAMDVSEEDRKDFAAQDFLRFLREFRTILLQDSVIIRFQFSQYLIWRDSIFVRKNYMRYIFKIE